MRIGWLLGWAVPPDWFAPLARRVLPAAEHTFVLPGPGAVAALAQAGPFDFVVGYSLGALLLLAEPVRAAALGPVRLLAPSFAFAREEKLGGRISRAELRFLHRRVETGAAGALDGFYARSGLDIFTLGDRGWDRERLLWGLQQLESRRIEPPLPAGWKAWCGAKDAFLDAARLAALDPAIAVVAEATHHPLELIQAWAEEGAS